MLVLLPLLVVPILVLFGMKTWGGSRFTWKEFVLLEGIMVIVLLTGFFGARWAGMRDVEIWNGHLTDKSNGTQSCCHCRDVCDSRDKDGRCTSRHEECDHTRDYWWSLDVSTGDQIYDGCSGTNRAPSWWRGAVVGEPAAIEHGFTNYLLADPDTVFDGRRKDASYVELPSFPRVHGKYKIHSAINLDTAMSTEAWNKALMKINDELGHDKQVHIVVIATREADPAFATHLDEGWLHGKKNNAIFVLGAPSGDVVEWARLVSFSNVPMLGVRTRDELIGKRLSDTGDMTASIAQLVLEEFHRTPMADFAYLASAATPPTWMVVLLYILGLGIAIGGGAVMTHRDPFGDERRGRYWR